MPTEKQHVRALKRAIDIAGGSQSALADRLAKFMKRPTVSQQLVSYWLTNETLLDPEWWPAFEAVTDNEVTRTQLRPDVFSSGQAA